MDIAQRRIQGQIPVSQQLSQLQIIALQHTGILAKFRIGTVQTAARLHNRLVSDGEEICFSAGVDAVAVIPRGQILRGQILRGQIL